MEGAALDRRKCCTLRGRRPGKGRGWLCWVLSPGGGPWLPSTTLVVNMVVKTAMLLSLPLFIPGEGLLLPMSGRLGRPQSLACSSAPLLLFPWPLGRWGSRVLEAIWSLVSKYRL